MHGSKIKMSWSGQIAKDACCVCGGGLKPTVPNQTSLISPQNGTSHASPTDAAGASAGSPSTKHEPAPPAPPDANLHEHGSMLDLSDQDVQGLGLQSSCNSIIEKIITNFNARDSDIHKTLAVCQASLHTCKGESGDRTGAQDVGIGAACDCSGGQPPAAVEVGQDGAAATTTPTGGGVASDMNSVVDGQVFSASVVDGQVFSVSQSAQSSPGVCTFPLSSMWENLYSCVVVTQTTGSWNGDDVDLYQRCSISAYMCNGIADCGVAVDDENPSFCYAFNSAGATLAQDSGGDSTLDPRMILAIIAGVLLVSEHSAWAEEPHTPPPTHTYTHPSATL